MKRSGTELKRSRIAPKAKAAPSPQEVAGRAAWAEATRRDGRCGQCGARGTMQGHHVVLARHVRARGGDPWDLRNRLSLCTSCHMGHHESSGRHRVRREALNAVHFQFMGELLGDQMRDYLDRHYPLVEPAREV